MECPDCHLEVSAAYNRPAALSYGDLRKAFNGLPNGSSAIYWVDAKIIEELRPRE